MNISELIEVAIGMVFVFLTVSLACSAAQEVLARWLNWRAKDLEVTLRDMLDNPPRTQMAGIVTDWWDRTVRWSSHQAGRPATNFVDALYKHPLITSLIKRNENAHVGPEQIPVQTFSLALFDMVMSAGTDASLIRQKLGELNSVGLLTTGLSNEQQLALQQELQQLSNTAGQLITSADPERVRLLRKQYTEFMVKYPFVPAARQVLLAALPELGPAVLDQFRRGVLRLEQKYPGLDLKQRLDALLIGVTTVAGHEEEAIAAARHNAETWFNDTMSRASSWYKTNVQKVLLAVGLVIAVILNVDSITVANTLWREPALRQAVADQARAATPPGGTSGDLGAIIGSTKASLAALYLPVGWTACATPAKTNTACLNGAEVPGDPVGWLTKLAGLFVTGLAAMQGGPFWFDMLGKLISVGEAGKKEQAK